MTDRFEGVPDENLASWLQPDVTAAIERRNGKIANGPERRLMVAVLEDAVLRFRKNAAAKTEEGKAIFAEEQQWLFGPGEDGPFSFESICDALGIDPSYLRRGLSRWARAQQKGFGAMLSMVPLLLGEGIPAAARRALLNHRPRDAGKTLMQAYGLSCDEAALLVDVNPCADAPSVASQAHL
ncbi:MAG TPA: hypothetical protein VL754_19945 [Verrucomicrobiae bacterium]|jgi:hypothetical protein|nr:hypothetical protein [Verrucomicrobiae bacterium]